LRKQFVASDFLPFSLGVALLEGRIEEGGIALDVGRLGRDIVDGQQRMRSSIGWCSGVRLSLTSNRVVVVEIDECSIEYFRARDGGGRPWSRQGHADLLDQTRRNTALLPC
jgi:hypothetical protein